jgi:hypothetical protein
MNEEKIVLGPIVGAVSHEKAKIWFYGTFDETGKLKPYCHVFNKAKTTKIPLSPFKFKEISSFPYDIKQNNGSKNKAGKAYIAEIDFPHDGEEFSFGVNYDGTKINDTQLKYTVKRSPEAGDIDFSFGLISCHKIMMEEADDEEKKKDRKRKKEEKKVKKMWGGLHEKMLEKKSAFLIQSGDQVYCDGAWEKSLRLSKEQNAGNPGNLHEKMLNNYRNFYFNSWKFDQVKEVMSTFPQYMIWDDHEIRDGWGSREEDDKNSNYQQVFKAAKEAYLEFQHSHNPEPLKKGAFYYAFHYGSAAFLVMDIRGERKINKDPKESRLMSREQWNEIENWLNTDKAKNSKILFVVTSVPVVHLNRKFGSLGRLIGGDDAVDQWSSIHNLKMRQKLLKKLIEWSGPKNKPVFLLGGDVHVGTEVCMKKKNTEIRIHQITSSPITNKAAWPLDLITAPFSSHFSFRLDGENKEFMCAEIVKRHRKRNFAIIEIKYDNGKPGVILNRFKEGKKVHGLKANYQMCECKNTEYKCDT